MTKKIPTCIHIPPKSLVRHNQLEDCYELRGKLNENIKIHVTKPMHFTPQ